MELKLNHYNTLDTNTKALLSVFNELSINDVTAKYIDGLPITEINSATVLAQHNSNKASKLPNYKEYLAAGIDLSATMPHCQETKESVEALESTVSEYGTISQYSKEVPYISYDSKQKQFIVNDAGKAALERAVITLTDKEKAAYNAVFEAHKLLAAIHPNVAKFVFSDEVVNRSYNNFLREDDLVYQMRKHNQ